MGVFICPKTTVFGQNIKSFSASMISGSFEIFEVFG
jgi:hypothetical protein